MKASDEGIALRVVEHLLPKIKEMLESHVSIEKYKELERRNQKLVKEVDSLTCHLDEAKSVIKRLSSS